MAASSLNPNTFLHRPYISGVKITPALKKFMIFIS